jgi:hypothetical protein
MGARHGGRGGHARGAPCAPAATEPGVGASRLNGWSCDARRGRGPVSCPHHSRGIARRAQPQGSWCVVVARAPRAPRARAGTRPRRRLGRPPVPRVLFTCSVPEPLHQPPIRRGLLSRVRAERAPPRALSLSPRQISRRHVNTAIAGNQWGRPQPQLASCRHRARDAQIRQRPPAHVSAPGVRRASRPAVLFPDAGLVRICGHENAPRDRGRSIAGRQRNAAQAKRFEAFKVKGGPHATICDPAATRSCQPCAARSGNY